MIPLSTDICWPTEGLWDDLLDLMLATYSNTFFPLKFEISRNHLDDTLGILNLQERQKLLNASNLPS